MSFSMSRDLGISSSIGLSALKNEPQRLAMEAERFNSDLEALVIDNYRLFVQNLAASAGQLPNEAIRRLSSLLRSDCEEVAEQCGVFKDKVSAFMNAHKRNRKTLQRHLQLVELLEVPQLVDACARNGFHDEALELANFVNSLEAKHLLASKVNNPTEGGEKSPGARAATPVGNGNSVVRGIVDDVQHTLVDLRKQLFVSLTETSSLPRQLYILGILRKLDSLLVNRELSLAERQSLETLGRQGSMDSKGEAQFKEYRQHVLKGIESRLQMDFLECRSIWLERLLADSNAGVRLALNNASTGPDALDHPHAGASDTGGQSPPSAGGQDRLGLYGRAIEMIEIYRTAWFEIISHFNALFQDSVGNVSSRLVLSGWIWNQYRAFSSELCKLLRKIDDGSSVRSVLEQCLHFASRLKDLECDFSGMIVTDIGSVVLNSFKESCSIALQRLEVMLSTERFAVDVEGMRREHIVPLYLPHDEAAPSAEPELTSDAATPLVEGSQSAAEIKCSTAPVILMDFPPLAHYLNAILTAMNYIRDCPIWSIRDDVLHVLLSALRSVCRLLEEHRLTIAEKGLKYTKVQFPSKSGKMDEIMASAFVNHLCPHVLLAFTTLFPERIVKFSEDAFVQSQSHEVKAWYSERYS